MAHANEPRTSYSPSFILYVNAYAESVWCFWYVQCTKMVERWCTMDSLTLLFEPESKLNHVSMWMKRTNAQVPEATIMTFAYTSDCMLCICTLASSTKGKINLFNYKERNIPYAKSQLSQNVRNEYLSFIWSAFLYQLQRLCLHLDTMMLRTTQGWANKAFHFFLYNTYMLI